MGCQAVGALVWAVTLVAVALLAQALQGDPDTLPVTAAAGRLPAGLGAQQPGRLQPLVSLGHRWLMVRCRP